MISPTDDFSDDHDLLSSSTVDSLAPPLVVADQLLHLLRLIVIRWLLF